MENSVTHARDFLNNERTFLAVLKCGFLIVVGCCWGLLYSKPGIVETLTIVLLIFGWLLPIAGMWSYGASTTRYLYDSFEVYKDWSLIITVIVASLTTIALILYLQITNVQGEDRSFAR